MNNTIETKLIKEKRILEEILNKARKNNDETKLGHLKIKQKKGKPEYYCDGKYLKKDQLDIAKRIAQRDYDESMIRKAEERVKVIEKFLKEYDKTSLKTLYKDTNEYRKQLIVAPIISDEEYIKNWQSVEYKGKNFEEDMPEIYTNKGERVRSKSEKIIADKLYSLEIPYRYEYPLMLSGNVKVYPDFTILKMPEREEVYLEHFGMMDDSGYVDKALFKLSTYERNGIYLGVNLFITYETSKTILNTRTLDGFMRKLFCIE